MNPMTRKYRLTLPRIRMQPKINQSNKMYWKQCCVPVMFWYGSGSGDSYLWLLDTDPAIFVSDLQDGNKICFFCLLLFEGTVHLHNFPKIKFIKKSKNRRNQGFFFLFLLDDRRDPDKDSYLWLTDPEDAQKHTDLDPQHWLQLSWPEPAAPGGAPAPLFPLWFCLSGGAAPPTAQPPQRGDLTGGSGHTWPPLLLLLLLLLLLFLCYHVKLNSNDKMTYRYTLSNRVGKEIICLIIQSSNL